MTTAKGILTIIVILLSGLVFSASAQTINTSAYTKSKVTVVASDNKTNIAVSNFPKQTSIVIFDSEDNLISIVSTNNAGAANITLPTTVKNIIYVKTLNGEILISNREINNENVEQLASKETAASNKA